MAGATYVLDKTYKCKTAGGIGRFRAVTKGTNDGEVILPAAANANVGAAKALFVPMALATAEYMSDCVEAVTRAEKVEALNP